MPDSSELKITLIFHHPSGRIPSRDVAKCLAHCEDSIYFSELDDLLKLHGPHVGVPLLVIDAMRYRLTRFRGTLLNVEHAAQGSIVLEGIVAAAVLWVLENTLGETLKESWKDSDLHKKIKALFLKMFADKPTQIADDVKRRIEADDELSLSVDVATTRRDEAAVFVFVHVTPRYHEHPIPLRSDYFEDAG